MEIQPMFENEKVVMLKPPFREDFDEYKKDQGIESGYETHGAMIRKIVAKCREDKRPTYILCSQEVYRKYVGRAGSFSAVSNGNPLICVVYNADIPKFGGVIDEMKLMAWIFKKYSHEVQN